MEATETKQTGHLEVFAETQPTETCKFVYSNIS